MKIYNSLRRLLPAVALGVALTSSMPAIAQDPIDHTDCPDSPLTKLDRLISPSSSHYLTIIAHRGLWGRFESPQNLTPENSMAAIRKASGKCLDGIELDVKMTQDGVPILMHDYNAGRTTDVYTLYPGQKKYSPETNTGFNPLISDLTWGQIHRLNLLLPNRSALSVEPVWSAIDAINAWREGSNQIPWIFDVKTASAVRAIDKAASNAYGENAGLVFAMKVNVSLYPSRGAYEADAHYLVGIPIFVTNNLSKMNVRLVYDAWEGDAATPVDEINVKEYNGNLSDIFNAAKGSNQAVGVFNALPDYDPPNTIGGRFYNANGSCCYRLADKLSNGDKTDLRWSWDFIRNAKFTFVTTDDPIGLANYLGHSY